MKFTVGIIVFLVLLLCAPAIKQQYDGLMEVNAQDKRLCAQYRKAREAKQSVKAYALAKQIYDLPEPRSCAPHWTTVEQNAVTEAETKGLSLAEALRQASQNLE